MPTNLHTQTRDLVHDVIKIYGNDQNGVLIKQTHTGNSISGGSSVSTTRYNMKMMTFKFRNKDIDGTNIKMDDLKVYISAKDANDNSVTPDKDDLVYLDSTTWKIIRVRRVRPAPGGPVYFFVAQCREA